MKNVLSFSLVFPQLHTQAKLRSCKAERCFFFFRLCRAECPFVEDILWEPLLHDSSQKHVCVGGGEQLDEEEEEEEAEALSRKSNKPHVGQVCRDGNQTDLRPSPIVFGCLPWKSHTKNSATNCSQTLQNWHHLLERKIIPWWGQSWGEAQLPERLATCLRIITLPNSQSILKHIQGAARVHPSQLASRPEPEAAWEHAWGYTALRNPPSTLVGENK